MSGKITRQTRNFEKLIKRIKLLAKSKVESGYFIEQGDHPEAEMTFVDLATMHEKGVGNFPQRSVRKPTLWEMNSTTFTAPIKKDISNYLIGKSDISNILDDAGKHMSRIAISLYGVPSDDMPSNADWWADLKGDDTPLVFDGYLRDAWSYKTSDNGLIKKIGGGS